MSEYVTVWVDDLPDLKRGERIVRCRDCVWYLPYPGIQITYGICQKSQLEVDDNGFCAWGELCWEGDDE